MLSNQIEQIAFTHLKKATNNVSQTHITHVDVLKNFQNSFHFIMKAERFKDVPLDTFSRMLGQDKEMVLYRKAQSLALELVLNTFHLELVHCPILGSKYELVQTKFY